MHRRTRTAAALPAWRHFALRSKMQTSQNKRMPPGAEKLQPEEAPKPEARTPRKETRMFVQAPLKWTIDAARRSDAARTSKNGPVNDGDSEANSACRDACSCDGLECGQ